MLAPFRLSFLLKCESFPDFGAWTVGVFVEKLVDRNAHSTSFLISHDDSYVLTVAVKRAALNIFLVVDETLIR